MAPTQPSKLTSPLAINLDPIKLLFSTPPTSPQAFLDSLKDLLPLTANPPLPRPSFDTIERMANNPPPIPSIGSTFPSPTPDMEPPLLPFPPHLSPNLPSINPTLPPLGPNNPFPMLTHEMYYFCAPLKGELTDYSRIDKTRVNAILEEEENGPGLFVDIRERV
ncbi:hypothetical protein Tco_0604890 [Tanacetum coccineum]